MDSVIVQEIATVILKAASDRRLVSYKRLHAMFSAGVPLVRRYEALSEAVWSLSDCRQLDYGALMTLDSGLPGDDFFARFRFNRRHEFESMMGAGSLGRSKTKKKLISDRERARVYEHAAQILLTRVDA